MYKYKLWIFSALIFIHLISNNVMAWNQYGHQAIGEIAFKDLSKKQRLELDNILDTLISRLSPQEKKIFKNQPYSLNKLSKLSILPDYWKHYKFKNLADKFGINDSNLIINLGELTTADWHYKSQVIKQPLEPTTTGKLDYVVDQLIANLSITTVPTAKALGIVYLTHLLEDAHQPLHSVSMALISDPNQHDKGGNLFCLQRKNKTACRYSLHEYWDSAGQSLTNKQSINKILKTVKDNYSKNKFLDKYTKLNPDIWLNESFQYWQFAYNTPRDSFPNKAYQAETSKIATEQIALAGYRLSYLINGLLNQAEQN